MTRPVIGKYSFDEFRKLVAEELLVDEEEITPKTSFADLRVDSVRMVDMMLRLEEQGISIPLEAGWKIETVGDAYKFYLEGMPTAPQRPSLAKRATEGGRVSGS